MSDKVPEAQIPSTAEYAATHRGSHPDWRPLLENHTAWRELTAPLKVEYRDDGVRVTGASVEEARRLHGLLVTVLGAAHDYPLRGGVDRTGELRVGIGG